MNTVHPIPLSPHQSKKELNELLGHLEGRSVRLLRKGMVLTFAISVLAAVGTLIALGVAIALSTPWLFAIPVVLAGVAATTFVGAFIPFALSSVRFSFAVDSLKKDLDDSSKLAERFSAKNSIATENILLRAQEKKLPLFGGWTPPPVADPGRTAIRNLYFPLAIDTSFNAILSYTKSPKIGKEERDSAICYAKQCMNLHRSHAEGVDPATQSKVDRSILLLLQASSYSQTLSEVCLETLKEESAVPSLKQFNNIWYGLTLYSNIKEHRPETPKDLLIALSLYLQRIEKVKSEWDTDEQFVKEDKSNLEALISAMKGLTNEQFSQVAAKVKLLNFHFPEDQCLTQIINEVKNGSTDPTV